MKTYQYCIYLNRRLVYEHPILHTSKEELCKDIQCDIHDICSDIKREDYQDEFAWTEDFEFGRPASICLSDGGQTYENCLASFNRVRAMTCLGEGAEWKHIYGNQAHPTILEASCLERTLKTNIEAVASEMQAILMEIMDGKDGNSDEWALQSLTGDIRVVDRMYERIRKVLATVNTPI